jgi:hypothetical protein
MRRFLFVVLAIASTAAAQAQTPPATGAAARFAPTPPSDTAAQNVLNVVISNITEAVDEQGRKLHPLTAEEAKTPLLDAALVKEVMDVAFASATGKACGLDWSEQNYRKLMQRERALGTRSTHQLAAISLTHGFILGRTGANMTCPEGRRGEVEDFYRRKWQ